MNGSKFAPISITQYGAKDLNASLQGTKFTAILGTETIHDYLVSDDYLIDGAIIIAISATIGDKVTCQVIDKDNVMGYGANVVLGQYVTNWYMNPNESIQMDFKSDYPAKIFAGLYLRIKYTSVGATNVEVITNFKLHKVLW